MIIFYAIFNRDFSNTSIESMPHIGLEKLEILRIQNTHTLKTIPSVYAFQVSHGGHELLSRGLHFCFASSVPFLYNKYIISVLLNNQTNGTAQNQMLDSVGGAHIRVRVCIYCIALLYICVMCVYVREWAKFYYWISSCIFSFWFTQNLRFAWLTHPFHCCAFKFPKRHDPYRHAQRVKYLAELHKKCMTKIKQDEQYTENIVSYR